MSTPDANEGEIELSIVIPCLNEAETLGICVEKALRALSDNGIRGEVVVADGESTDGSQAIAEKLGARVVTIPIKGYGSGLRGGIAAARGRFILMGDADDSHDFSGVMNFLTPLRKGEADLVMGNRFAAGIRPGVMTPLNQYIGNPLMSGLGRLFFRSPVGDFQCGLRAFTKAAAQRMNLRTTGMEFASEMVIKATLQKLRIVEVPTLMSKDGRSRPPHLRPFRDGWRNLRFMLLFSPRWLFLYPGLLLMVIGFLAGAWLLPEPRSVGGITFGMNTLLYCAAAILIGFQAVTFAFFTKVFAITEGLMLEDPKLDRLFKYFTLETGLIGGALLILGGLAASLFAVFRWGAADFAPMDLADTLRWVIPGMTCLTLGFQVALSSFFLSVLGLKRH